MMGDGFWITLHFGQGDGVENVVGEFCDVISLGPFG